MTGLSSHRRGPLVRSRISAGWASLGVALRTRAVRFGLLGSICIVLGSLSPAYLPAVSPVWDVLYRLDLDGPISKWTGTVLTMVGLALLLECWLRLRPARRRALGQPQLRHWAVLAVIAAPFLLAPPIFSHDAYSYAAQGWMLQNHINPYEVGPGVLPGYFADQVAWVWRDTAAPYGPLALRMSHWIVVLAGFDPFWSAILMRLPALVGVVLIGVLVPRIASRVGVDPAAASWFVVLNPILVIDFIGGAHNDALMAGLMVLGIWVVLKYRHWWLGAAIVGVAAAIKQPAFLAAVALPFLARPWTSWRLRSVAWAGVRAAASLAIAVAVFAGLSVATGLGFGWVNAVNVPGMVDTVSPFSVLGHVIQYPLNLLGLDPTGRQAIAISKSVGVGVAAVGICILAVRHLGRRPIHFLAWSLLLFAVCAPALHSWYVLWGGVLLPMARPSSRWLRTAVVVVGVLLGFAAMNFAIRNGLWIFALLLIWVIWESVHAHELKQQWEAPHREDAEWVSP